jgi:hypothetical protein
VHGLLQPLVNAADVEQVAAGERQTPALLAFLDDVQAYRAFTAEHHLLLRGLRLRRSTAVTAAASLTLLDPFL